MVKSLISAALLFTSIAIAKPSDARLCEAYRGVNSALQCSSDNYLIRFGYNYCLEYVRLEEYYQPATQTVLAKIRSCLVNELIDDPQLSCATSESRAMKHHLKCYSQSGFCSLPWIEKLKIFGPAFTEIRHETFRATMLAASDQCARQK